MSYNLVLKDDKYYEDLIYTIKKSLLGPRYNSSIIESRIRRRKNGGAIKDELPTENCSSFFESELEDLFSDIYSDAKTPYKGLSEVHKCPELANKAIEELTKRRLENHMLRCLFFVVTDMGFGDELHLGEPKEPGIYLSRNEQGWETIVAESNHYFIGITKYRQSAENCYHACVDVINLLADNKVSCKKETNLYGKKVKSLKNVNTIL